MSSIVTYSNASQCSHKMIVSKRQAQMFSGKPFNMKLSGQVFLYVQGNIIGETSRKSF